jgi:uncharacterized protein YndB with AHSA1/START domain
MIDQAFESASRTILADDAGVERARIFRAEGLKAGGRFFGFVSRGDLVVKLPGERVAELIAAGEGTVFDRARGAPMREWVRLRPADEPACAAYLREARRFVAGDADYARRIPIEAPRERVFDALATPEGLRGWWTPDIGGDADDIELRFGSERIVMHVDEARRPEALHWTCVEHTGHREWESTELAFELVPDGTERCIVHFRHMGLVPALGCYEVCERGWDSFLAGSLVGLVEVGRGAPFQPMTTAGDASPPSRMR